MCIVCLTFGRTMFALSTGAEENNPDGDAAGQLTREVLGRSSPASCWDPFDNSGIWVRLGQANRLQGKASSFRFCEQNRTSPTATRVVAHDPSTLESACLDSRSVRCFLAPCL